MPWSPRRQDSHACLVSRSTIFILLTAPPVLAGCSASGCSIFFLSAFSASGGFWCHIYSTPFVHSIRLRSSSCAMALSGWSTYFLRRIKLAAFCEYCIQQLLSLSIMNSEYFPLLSAYSPLASYSYTQSGNGKHIMSLNVCFFHLSGFNGSLTSAFKAHSFLVYLRSTL